MSMRLFPHSLIFGADVTPGKLGNLLSPVAVICVRVSSGLPISEPSEKSAKDVLGFDISPGPNSPASASGALSSEWGPVDSVATCLRVGSRKEYSRSDLRGVVRSTEIFGIPRV